MNPASEGSLNTCSTYPVKWLLESDWRDTFEPDRTRISKGGGSSEKD